MQFPLEFLALYTTVIPILQTAYKNSWTILQVFQSLYDTELDLRLQKREKEKIIAKEFSCVGAPITSGTFTMYKFLQKDPYFKPMFLFQPSHQSLLLANGTTSARGVDRGVGSGDVLQTGQVGCSRNHGSIHLRWKRWLQSGSSRSISVLL
jgi:hypothetical protein